MAESTRAAANRATGPRTAEGKRRSSRNALRHGLRSTALVLPGERQADWNRHLAGVVESVAPRDYLEAFLAADVAAQTWRLARATRFEQEMARAELEGAEEAWKAHRRRLWDKDTVTDLGQARAYLALYRRGRDLLHLLAQGVEGQAVAPELLEAKTVIWVLSDIAAMADVDELEVVELPEDQLPEWWQPAPGHKWTCELLRSAVQQIAAAAEQPAADLAAMAFAQTAVEVAQQEVRIAEAERDLERFTARRTLPNEAELERIQRYESHLRRGLARSLDQLRTLQARTVEHGPGGSEEPGSA